MDYTRSNLTASSRALNASKQQQLPKMTQVRPTQGLYIQRIGQLQRTEKPGSSMTTLSTSTSVSVHLPYREDRWAWACLCVPSLSFFPSFFFALADFLIIDGHSAYSSSFSASRSSLSMQTTSYSNPSSNPPLSFDNPFPTQPYIIEK